MTVIQIRLIKPQLKKKKKELPSCYTVIVLLQKAYGDGIVPQLQNEH